MKLKTSLSLMLESLLNGDLEGAKNHLSQYMTRKTAGIVNEYGYGYDYDPGYDNDNGNDNDYFNGSEDIEEVLKLKVDGVEVTAKIYGTQKHAAHEERASFHDPGYYEIYEYGPIKLSSLNAMTIAGKTVFDGVDLFEDATAEHMLSNVDDYAQDLYECILETHESVEPLPQNIMTLVTPEFCAKIVIALAKELKSREGKA